MTKFNYSEKAHVLVLGNDSRATLAVVRSLGSNGISVFLGIDEEMSIVPYSRFVSRVIKFPSLSENISAWQEKLKKLLIEYNFDLVIPVSESSLVAIVNKRKVFESLSKIAIPDEYGFKNSYYKQKTHIMAKKLGIPVPYSVFIGNIQDFESISQDILSKFPLMVKPAVPKVWVEENKIELGVKKVKNMMELKNEVMNILSYTEVVIQEYIEGIGIGQEFLCYQGKIINVFQHERIHEPTGSGGSSLRKSSPINKKLYDYSNLLILHLKWSGVLMIEYRYDSVNNNAVLIEINGRFWGSLPLAIFSGVNFPINLYNLMNQKEILPQFGNYKIDIYSRNLINDIKFILRNYNTGFFRKILIIEKEFIKSIIFFIVRKEYLDTITLDDPLPGIMEFWYEFTKILKYLAKKFEKIFYSLYYYLFLYCNRNRCIKKITNGKPSILFVCLGNISRSPFAEAYLKKKVNLELITSAGIYRIQGRPSPFFAQVIGNEFGINLKKHISKKITSELISQADVVFCMGIDDYKFLRRKFPFAKNNFFFLNIFNPSIKNFEIKDPYNKNISDFRESFNSIALSINNLSDIIGKIKFT